MTEDARDEPAGRVVAAAHAALVHHLFRSKIVVTAEALWGRGEKEVPMKRRRGMMNEVHTSALKRTFF